MKAHLAICLIVTLLSAFPANAEKYYKWQDESGAWHYSSKPPKEQQAEALTVRAKAPSQSDDEIAAHLLELIDADDAHAGQHDHRDAHR